MKKGHVKITKYVCPSCKSIYNKKGVGGYRICTNCNTRYKADRGRKERIVHRP